MKIHANMLEIKHVSKKLTLGEKGWYFKCKEEPRRKECYSVFYYHCKI